MSEDLDRKEKLEAELAEIDAKIAEKFGGNTIEADVSVQGDDAVVEIEIPTDDLEEEPEEAEADLTETLRFGYTVGVKEDGGFVFELHGEDKGVVQLLGLTRFAENQIERIHDIALKQGDALLNQGLALLYQEIQTMKRAMGINQDDQG
jgi:hypothetical protein